MTIDARRRIWIGAGLAMAGCASAAVLGGLGFGWLPARAPGPLERSAAAYDRGEYEEAAGLAREYLLRVDGEDAEALRLLARSLSRSGLEDSAMAIYERRLAPEAMQAEDRYLLGVGLDRRGQAELALESWAEALEEDPDHAETLAGLAYVHSRGGRFEEARRAAARLAEVPGWEGQGELMLGVSFAEGDDPAGAADWLGRALRRDPPPPGMLEDPARYRLLLARSALRAGRPEEAAAPLRDLLAVGPSAEASWLLSRVALQLGDAAGVAAALEGAGSYRLEHPIDPEPSPYVGEARCVECHPGPAREAGLSRHSRTLHRGEALRALPLPDGPLADPDEPGVTHRIGRGDDGTLEVETEVDGRSFRAVIEQAFGDPGRYVTMVSRDEQGAYRTLRHSYYHGEAGSGWDRSLGDTGRPDRLANALGRPVESREGWVRCLACHTTNVRFGREQEGPETRDAGIGCERCHGPGGHHLEAVAAGLADLAIVDPADASPAAVTASCSECHVLDSTEAEPTSRTDPAWVRSQGRTLTWSRCYTETGGAIGCLSCHDPHGPSILAKNRSEAACLSCHGEGEEPTSGLPDLVPRVSCPVEPAQGCIDCHMPSVEIPGLHGTLTDHYIRIVSPGDRP